ncbi:hypothetical protein ABGB18_34365 [Nonomuraea sp. B12E4]|uniref:hypothetical protein n=1 Tax=Nonomuraea sp. B12E4 TaxID=3153564 RepID=UPI00325E513C
MHGSRPGSAPGIRLTSRSVFAFRPETARLGWLPVFAVALVGCWVLVRGRRPIR